MGNSNNTPTSNNNNTGVRALDSNNGVNAVIRATIMKNASLFTAINEGDLFAIGRQITLGADVCAEDSNNETPLHKVARRGHIAAIKLLISEGADVGATEEHNYTPLHIASYGGRVAAIELLIANGAGVNDVGGPDEYRYTPLHIAALNGHVPSIEVLVAEGADLRAAFKDGRIPLHCFGDQNNHRVRSLLTPK